jgi:HEAT repeat protein
MQDRNRKLLTSLLIGLAVTSMATAKPVTVDDARIQKLGSDSREARVEAEKALLKIGAPAIPALTEILDKQEDPSYPMAYRTLQRMVARYANTVRRGNISFALAKQLNADHKPNTKYALCRFIGLISTNEAAPALSKAIAGDDPRLRERARWALARMSGHRANDILIAQLNTDDPDWKVAVINGLGQQASPRAIPALQKQLEQTDHEAVQQAILDALARIADRRCLETIQQAMKNNTPGANSALLDMGDTFVKADMNAESVAALKAVYDNEKATVGERCRAIRGLAQTDNADAIAIVLEAMNNGNPRIQETAVQASPLIRGEEPFAMLADKVASADTQLKIELLGELGTHGRDEVLSILEQAADDENADARAAAFKAMEALNDPAAVDTLIADCDRPAGADRQAAEQALMGIKGADISKRIMKAYVDATQQQKPSLLRALGRRSGEDAVKLYRKAIQSNDEEVRAAAAYALGFRPLPGKQKLPQEDTKLLTEAAKRGPEQVTVNAVDSMIRLARRIDQRNQDRAADLFVEALELAQSEQHKSACLIGIGATVDPERTELLPAIEPMIYDGDLRQEAAQAAVPLAVNLPQSEKARAVKILTTAAKLKTGNALQAIEHLRKEYEIIHDPAHEKGFITVWWLAGPFPNPDNLAFEKAYFPEMKVDLLKGGKVEDREYDWNRHFSLEDQAVVDLREAVSERGNAAVYAYNEISVDQEKDAVMNIGSDDGIVVWVNGEKVHATPGPRGLTVDQDKVNIHLKEGANTILAKILDQGGHWEFTIRLTTADGEPLDFTQKRDLEK